jgi:catechol 2,3-dioxygenase-like lactoylglutathione lyase family enzyme
MTVPAQTGIAFGGVTPVLRVRDVSVSTDYYVRLLGFKIDFQTPGFVSVSRGRCCLFLCEGDQGNPGSWVWIDAKDVEAVHEEYRGAGAKIRNPPTNYPWALEMQVEDPDGNVLRLGSDPRHDEPTGDWLDMRGNRWSATREGGWVKKERN